MGFFSKNVSDEEWLEQAKPLYEASLPLTTALDEVIANPPLPVDYQKDLQNLFSKLSTIAESIRRLPNPTSSEARQAKKNLESAIKGYAKGIEYGLSFYKGAYGELGDIYASGVGLHKIAGGTLGGILLNFVEHIEKSQKIMEKASAYFPTL